MLLRLIIPAIPGLTGWGLNDMRVSLYSDANGTPLWNFPTGQYDPFVDISVMAQK